MKRILSILLTAITLTMILNGCAQTEAKKTIPEQDFTKVTSTVTITASNFAFDQAEYHVKKSSRVLIDFVNKEGNHGLSIADLDVSLVGSGKQVVDLSLPGTYDIRCGVPCGTGHMNMSAKLIVE